MNSVSATSQFSQLLVVRMPQEMEGLSFWAVLGSLNHSESMWFALSFHFHTETW